MIILLALACCATAFEFGKSFRSEFFINSSITPLNNGAFGSVLRTVMSKQIGYMTAMEEGGKMALYFFFFFFEMNDTGCDNWFHNNVAFGLLNATRAKVAAFVGSNVENLVLVDNASAACNAALRSLKLAETDLILRLSWEYPLGVEVTNYVSYFQGATLVVLNMSFPTDEETIVREFEAGLAKYKPKIAFFGETDSF